MKPSDAINSIQNCNGVDRDVAVDTAIWLLQAGPRSGPELRRLIPHFKNLAEVVPPYTTSLDYALEAAKRMTGGHRAITLVFGAGNCTATIERERSSQRETDYIGKHVNPACALLIAMLVRYALNEGIENA